MSRVVLMIPLCLPGLARAEEPVRTFRQGPVTLRVTATKTEKGRLKLALSDSLRVELRVEGDPEIDFAEVTKSPGWKVRTLPEPRTFVLDPYLPAGVTTLEWEPLHYRVSSDAPWQEITWPPLEIEITTTVVEPSLDLLRDDLPPERLPEEPAWEISLWPWAVAGLGLFLLLLGGRWYLRFRSRPVPSSPPLEEARVALLRLRESSGSSTERCEELARILRHYIERATGLPASRCTTAELIREARAREIRPEEWLRDSEHLLERCDWSKFTGREVDPSEVEMLLDRAEAWLHQDKRMKGEG